MRIGMRLRNEGPDEKLLNGAKLLIGVILLNAAKLLNVQKLRSGTANQDHQSVPRSSVYFPCSKHCVRIHAG